MARGVNKVILLGNLGNDPEMKFTQGGMAIANMSLATTASKKVGDQYEDVTSWHRVKAFGKLAEICGEYLHKGSQVYIEGRIEYGSYEKDGVKHYTTDIIADEMRMLGPREGGESQQRSSPQRSERQARPATRAAQPPREEHDPFRDDDIPF